MFAQNKCPVESKGCSYREACDKAEAEFTSAIADAAAKTTPPEIANAAEATIYSLESKNKLRFDIAANIHEIPDPLAQILDRACVQTPTGLVGDILRLNYFRIYPLMPADEANLYSVTAKQEGVNLKEGGAREESFRKKIEYFFKVAKGEGQSDQDILKEGAEFVYQHICGSPEDPVSVLPKYLDAIPPQFQREVELRVVHQAMMEEKCDADRKLEDLSKLLSQVTKVQQDLSVHSAKLETRLKALAKVMAKPPVALSPAQPQQ
jgi:hypothetical protein